MKVDILAEGGSVKGMAHVGALAALKDHGFEPENVAGTSAGAITAATIAAGYTPEEIKDIMMDLDFRLFLDGPRFKIKKIWNIYRRVGICKGDFFYNWIKELLSKKGIKTFGDLSIEGETDLRWRWKLKVTSSDITKKRLLIFPDDAILFDIDPDNLEVATAIRASMSIPFLFIPIKIGGSYQVDGGVNSNWPIFLFDSDGEPSHPTFGLLLKEDLKPYEDFMGKRHIKRTLKYILDLGQTMMSAHDKRSILPGDYEHRTIEIPVGDIDTFDFDLSKEKKNFLYNSGFKAANNFLSTWDWESYKSWAIRVRS